MSRRAVLGLLTLSACGIDAVGTAPKPETQSLPDASLSDRDGSAPDASACRSILTATLTPGSLLAPKASAAPTIDGDLSDWDTCFVRLDKNTAQISRDLAGGGAYVSGELSVVQDGAKVWIAARITGIAPLGIDGAQFNHENDSLELYFDGDGTTQAGYGADAVQLVIDYGGRVQAWRSDVLLTPSGVRAASKVAADGSSYAIEVEVTPATFGRSTLASTMGFDFAFNNGSGSDQLTQLVWFQKCRQSTGCGCPNGGDAPWCDSRQFGTLTLLR